MKSTAWRNPPPQNHPRSRGPDKPHRPRLSGPSWGCVVVDEHGQHGRGGGGDRYVPVPTPKGCSPHGPLAQPGVLAAPQAQGASRSSVRGTGQGQRHRYEAALGPALPRGVHGLCTPLKEQGVPPVSQCKFRESQGTAARLRLWMGGAPGAREEVAAQPPGVQRRS